MATHIFKRYVNDTSTSETDIHERSGQPVTIVHELDPATYDRDEIGTMFRISFADGFTASAFASELTPYYPEHTKMTAVSAESQAIGDFIENSKYVLMTYDEDGDLVAPMKSTSQILAEWFDIDLNAIGVEKQRMLEALRSN